MKLSSIFLILIILSMPAIASENNGFASHKFENNSLFSEVSNKSVLQSVYDSDAYTKKNISGKSSEKSISYSLNSHTLYLTWNWNPSEKNSGYEDLPKHINNVDYHYIPNDVIGHYFSHNSLTYEHSFGYKELLDDKKWGVYDDWDRHHICTPPVPEPESYAMVLIGLLMIVMVKRRRA